MSVPSNTLLALLFSLSAPLAFSCQKQEIQEKSYPYVLEYDQLTVEPSQWFVLNSNSYSAINQPPNLGTALDEEIKNTLLDDQAEALPFNRLEFLSDSTVNVRLVSGGSAFNTIMTYRVESGRTEISVGGGVALVLNTGAEANSLVLRMYSTFYTYIKPNGTMDQGPIEFHYSDIRNIPQIIGALRQKENLQPNDTVAVNFADFLFK